MTNFGPTPLGPGSPGPGSYPPMPLAGYPPGTQPPSSAWKYVLMGCAIVVLLGIVITAGTCYYLGQKGPELAQSVMKMAKPTYLNMLTPDHTAEERENFSNHLDRLFEALGQDGLMKFGEKYSANFQELQQISEDQRITVEESQDWCEHLDQTMSGQPAGQEEGEDVPF